MRLLSVFLAAWIAVLVNAAAQAEEPEAEQGPDAQEKQPRLEVSTETTVIEGPLTEDGYVDYLAALNQRASRGVTPQNNAVVLLIQAFGPEIIDEEIRQDFFLKLGVAPPPADGDYLVSLEELYRRQAEQASSDELNELNDVQHKAMFAPWSAKQFPLVARWVQRNDPPLAKVTEAVKRSQYYAPLVSPDEDGLVAAVLLPATQHARESARVLGARAMLRLERGETEAAWSDLYTIHRLARLVGQGETLIDALVAIALHGVALDATGTLLHEGKPSLDRVRRIEADLAKLPSLPKMSEKIDVGERYMFLSAVTLMARKGPGALGELTGDAGASEAMRNAAAAAAIDWNVVARRGNLWYDRIVEAARLPTHAQRARAAEKIGEDIAQLGKETTSLGGWAKSLFFAGGNLKQVMSEQMSNVLMALLIPAFETVMIAEDRARAQADLLQIAVGLAAYRAEQGEYPENLAQLTPKHLDKLPPDLYTSEPLHYQRTEKGYLLYSVGPNLKDNQGAEYEDYPNHDIVLRQPQQADE